jgi:hypothetical protein
MIEDRQMIALLARSHAGDCRAGDTEDAFQIDVEGVVPFPIVEAGERTR